MVFELCEQTDKETDILITILCSASRGELTRHALRPSTYEPTLTVDRRWAVICRATRLPRHVGQQQPTRQPVNTTLQMSARHVASCLTSQHWRPVTMAHDVSCRVSGPVDTRTNVLGRHSSGRVGSCPRDQILLAVKVARQSLGDIETTYTLLLFYCEMYVFYWLFCIGCWATLTARQMSAVKNDSRHHQRLTVF